MHCIFKSDSKKVAISAFLRDFQWRRERSFLQLKKSQNNNKLHCEAVFYQLQFTNPFPCN